MTAAAPQLGQVIEAGEVTTRSLNVLLADSRQLGQFVQELARRTGDRAEIEAIYRRTDGARDRGPAGAGSGSTARCTRWRAACPPRRAQEHRAPTPDELVKLVDTAATDLGPEVEDYFRRMQDLLTGLREATALLALLGEDRLAGGRRRMRRGPHPLEGMRAEQDRRKQDLDTLRAAARAPLSRPCMPTT